MGISSLIDIQGLWKRLTEFLYGLSHQAEIAAQAEKEAQWRKTEQGYLDNITELQGNYEAAIADANAKDATIAALQTKVDALTGQIQKVEDDAKAKDADVDRQSDDAALHSKF